MRQLLYRQRKGLPTAENRIACQEHDWSDELGVTLWFDVPRLQWRKVIFTWANLRFPVEGHSPAVAKPIDDRDCSTIVSARAVTDIDDEALKVVEVMGNRV